MVVVAAMNASINDFFDYNAVEKILGKTGSTFFYVAVAIGIVALLADWFLGGGYTFQATCGDDGLVHRLDKRAKRKMEERRSHSKSKHSNEKK